MISIASLASLLECAEVPEPVLLECATGRPFGIIIIISGRPVLGWIGLISSPNLKNEIKVAIRSDPT